MISVCIAVHWLCQGGVSDKTPCRPIPTPERRAWYTKPNSKPRGNFDTIQQSISSADQPPGSQKRWLRLFDPRTIAPGPQRHSFISTYFATFWLFSCNRSGPQTWQHRPSSSRECITFCGRKARARSTATRRWGATTTSG